jgi:Macrocin-O-methyltransferase (TylF)
MRKKKIKSTVHKIQTRGTEKQLAARQTLLELYNNNPLPPDQLVTNLGLFTRASVLAKVMYINELYQRIINTPGVIMEFGVWWGQNLVFFESMRAMYEPYNYTRRVVGFDTFTGYTTITEKDGNNELVAEGAYSVSEGYEQYLNRLLDYHEQENAMGHIKKHELVKGDVTITTEQYLKKHPETIIALAYFDLQLYEPTKKCLEVIKPHLTRGSVIAMDEINCREFPGETLALKEVWGLDKLRIIRSQFLPDRSYIIFD